MAKAYSVQEELPYEVDFKNYNPELERVKEEEYLKKLKEFCLERTSSKNELIGEIVRTPQGDGYALYMVYNTKPLELLHIPIGDAWHADNVWLRGLRLADVKQMVAGSKKLKELFGSKKILNVVDNSSVIG